MKIVMLSLLLLTLLGAALPIAAQQPDLRRYNIKRATVFANKEPVVFRATLLKATDDYLIVSNPQGEQQVVWVTRYAELRKKHSGLLARTRKAYTYELVPGTAAKLEAVADQQGRLILKRLTVQETIEPNEQPDQFGEIIRK